ncbi:MAG: dihydrolipoamide acetyltransferase family protein [Polyangiales bacterium]
MASFEFRLPDLGEGVAEGEVVAWRVEPGQRVAEDQDMVEVMTDKATVTIGAPRAGRIARLNAQVGETIKVGEVLIVIDTDAATEPVPEKRASSHPPDVASSRFQAPVGRAQARATPAPPAVAKEKAVTASAVGDLREVLPGASYFASQPATLNGQKAPHARALPTEERSFYSEKPLATPATRKLARDLGIDLRRVRPSGAGGRVTQDDLRSFAPAGESAVATHAKPEREERTPFVGLRRKIAERMQMSKQKAAHFTFVEEVEVDALKQLVERARPAAEAHGVKLNYLPFIVKAVTLALQKHPILNSTLDERSNELVYRRYYHIGVATATEHGLVVPVVRDADTKSPLQIARDIQRLADEARGGALHASELSGSTFTVTSLGRQGGLLATPVLNYPEVGILGVHRVKERPVVRNGQIVIGHVMLLSLSFDHRIIDGHVGAAFAYDVIAYLERPELLLLELS